MNVLESSKSLNEFEAQCVQFETMYALHASQLTIGILGTVGK